MQSLSEDLDIALNNPKQWSGMKVKSFPVVDRIWTSINGKKTCLHKIYPLAVGEVPYYHPHPWEFETEIIRGSYLMEVGQSDKLDMCPPPVGFKTRICQGSSYTMTPYSWHSIEPVSKHVYSIVTINKKVIRQTPDPWETIAIMPRDQIKELLNEFKMILIGR